MPPAVLCPPGSPVPLLLQESANREHLEGSDLQIPVSYCPSHIFGVGVPQTLSDEAENPLSHCPKVGAIYLAVSLNMGYKHKEQLSTRNF